MKKDWLIKVTVNNSGLDFEDDVSLILLTTGTEVEKAYVVQNALVEIDEHLREEDKNGECLYNEYGWNASVLMDEVCKKYGWSWEYLNADIDVCI